MKNIHLISTDKSSRLQINRNNKLFLSEYPKLYSDCININICITSNEEIKEGDFFLHPFNTIHKAGGNLIDKDFKKIILTTDPKLIEKGIQAIDDEFLQWFVKNSDCEYVNIERNFADEGIKGITYYGKYFIITPKEEPKSHSFCETPQENCLMNYCDENGCINRKRELVICDLVEPKQKFPQIGTKEWNELASIYFRGKPKQETLEEAAKDFIENEMKFSFNSLETKTQANRMLKCVDFGAKWQQERSYSEEEVLNLLEWCGRNTYHNSQNLKPHWDNQRCGNEKDILNKWVEQFKKK